MQYLSVVNWDRYQHYKHRRPPWIRLYFCILDDPKLYELSDASKLHLFAIMLLASQHDNKIPFKKPWIASAIRAKSRINWQELLGCGFLECTHDASAAQAERTQHANPLQIVTDSSDNSETEVTDSSERASTSASTRPKKSAAPNGFELTVSMRSWAAKEVPEINLVTETAQFLDHHRAKQSRFVDWEAAWRNWMRNALKFKQARPTKQDIHQVNQATFERFVARGRDE